MRWVSAGCAVLLAGAVGIWLAPHGPAPLATELSLTSVRVQHEPPTNPAHRAIYERIRNDATFARSRDFFSLFRLPREITFRTRNCTGRGGAWYYEGTVTICYEYFQTIFDNARSAERPAWLSEEAAIAGPIADVVLHEGAHALFEFFRTPLLGREEDAADMVATFALLNIFKTEAKALVSGIAYSYLNDAQARNFTDLPTLANRVVPSRAYGGAHSTALQRLFSVVCHASGFDEAAYKDLVAMSELPPWRAGSCDDEYKQIAHAFHTLLGPHIDRQRAQALFPDAKWVARE
jgi:hypothetical protein